MSEYMWGNIRTRPTAHAERIMQQVCQKHGGPECGWVWANLPEGARGWFVGPNRGEPFDSELRDAVMDDLAELGILDDEWHLLEEHRDGN